MASTMLFFSCSQYDNDLDSLNLELENSVKYSGEEIFKGLFFFQNDITKNISHLEGIKTEIESIKNDRNEVVKSLEELSEISVSYINEKYPFFFNKLQTAMYSGNLYEIESSLNKSVKMIEQATLTSDKYSQAFLIGEKIQNNPELKNQILKLDLNNENDVKKFRDLVSQISNIDEVGTNKAIFFAGAAAVFYIVAAAVSFVVAAYSVITKAAYWDITKVSSDALISENSSVTKEVIIAEISTFFNQK
jgi:SdpC family antimicrobial peptide